MYIITEPSTIRSRLRSAYPYGILSTRRVDSTGHAVRVARRDIKYVLVVVVLINISCVGLENVGTTVVLIYSIPEIHMFGKLLEKNEWTLGIMEAADDVFGMRSKY